MNVLLVGPDLEENLSLGYLQASLERCGYSATQARFNSPEDVPHLLELALSADIIGLSMSYQAFARDYLRIACKIKKSAPWKIVIAGGGYASCTAVELMEHHPEIDIVVIHEGEQTLCEVVDTLAASGGNLAGDLQSIQGIAYKSQEGIQITPPRTKI